MNKLINRLYQFFCDNRYDTNRDENPDPISINDMTNIRNDIIDLSVEIKNIYPHYSSELFYLKDSLFLEYVDDYDKECYLFGNNTFVQIFTILKALKYEIDNGNNLGFWEYIHPMIIKVAQKLYFDKHYHKSVLAAYIEI